MIVLALTRQARISLPWLVVALLFFGAYLAALIFLGDLLPLSRYFGQLEWNWGGKIVAILVSVVLLLGLWLIGKRPPREAGFTFAQKPGSLVPALVATVLLVAGAIGIELWSNDGTDTGMERLLYQATMPGLDEEFYWRGVFLLAMSEAVKSERFNLLGAGIGWGGVLACLLFGLGHGLAYEGGQFTFSGLIVGLTGVIGFGLLWIRERTGSILIPIIAHNLFNFLASFF